MKRKAAALQDIRDVVEKKLEQMLAQNPQRMDYYKKYQEIVADYNREKDRVTIEETFARLVDFTKTLDAEQKRAAEEGLSQDESDVKMFILDNLYASLPRPPFSEEDTESLAGRVYDFVCHRSAAGAMFVAAA